MRTIPYIRLAVLCWLVSLCLSCSDSSRFYLLDKGEFKLDDFQGQWLIINFWAEWCRPCREEVPELNQLHSIATQENVMIIGISYDPLENSRIREIVAEWDVRYPVMGSKPMPILPFKLPKTLPGNYILSPEGELVAKLSGTQTFESLTKLLKTLRKKRHQSQ